MGYWNVRCDCSRLLCFFLHYLHWQRQHISRFDSPNVNVYVVISMKPIYRWNNEIVVKHARRL